MIKKISGNENTIKLLGNIVSELNGRSSALNPKSHSVTIQRGTCVVELERHQSNPTKSFLTITQEAKDSSKFGIKELIERLGERLLLSRDEVRVEIDNATGRMRIKKSIFQPAKKICNQVIGFLNDLQPENRNNAKKVQPCSYGIMGEKFAESTVEKYSDHEIKFLDSFI